MVTRPAALLVLAAQERQDLLELSRARAAEARLVERSKIILLAADGLPGRDIAQQVKVSPRTVRRWCDTYRDRRAADPDSSVVQRLADRPRVGPPDRFDELFWTDVLAIATAAPETYGRPITHWTVRELTEVVVENSKRPIHFTTVARFLKRTALQPHRVQQWMNRKPDPTFDARASDIKDCLVAATASPPPAKVITVSFDEKTGVQAKERLAPAQPLRPGQPERQEFEYQRHGTLVLLAMMLVHTGVVRGRTLLHRGNEATAALLRDFLGDLLAEGYERVHLILDQLNTHWSYDLVATIARLCPLPVPGREEMATGQARRAWLAAADKSIVLHFTPVHAS